MIRPVLSSIIFLALSAIDFPGPFSPVVARESGGNPYGALNEHSAQSDCPRTGLRMIFEDAVTGDDLIAAINREQQILVLCQERQALINAVLEREQEYRKLIGEASLETDDVAPLVTNGGIWDSSGASGNGESGPSGSASASSGAIPPPPPIPVPGIDLTPSLPDYSWYTLYGSGDNLTVGIAGRSASGGSPGHWLRQQGGELPGGWRVVTLHARPVKITLKRGDQLFDLPYVKRDRPGRGANATDAESFDDAAIEALLEGRR